MSEVLDVHLRLLSLFVTGCLLMGSSASAALVDYKMTGGTINGTLNGVSFTGANFAITATADSSTFNSQIVDSVFLVLSQPAVCTMTIDGFAPFQITNPDFGPVMIDLAAIVPGLFEAGFAFQTSPDSFQGFAADGLARDDLVDGTGYISGGLVGTETASYTTTVGDLLIDTISSGPATFGPAPEPTSLAIFGLGALGLAFHTRRKLRS